MRREIFLLFGAIAFLALSALPLQGQDGLSTAWFNYQQAHIAYRASVDGRNAISTLHGRSLDEMEAAIASGQANRRRNALRDAQAWGNNLSGAEATVSRRRSELRDAVEDLLTRLRAAAAVLESNLLGPVREANVTSSWRDSLRETRENITQLEDELQELEGEVSPVGIVLVQRDPRTSPQEYLNVADLHERRVRIYDDLIADSEAQIQIWRRERANDLELRTQGRWESNPAGGRPPLGGSLTFEDRRTGQIASEEAKQESYRVAREVHREQARIARAFAAGREP